MSAGGEYEENPVDALMWLSCKLEALCSLMETGDGISMTEQGKSGIYLIFQEIRETVDKAAANCQKLLDTT